MDCRTVATIKPEQMTALLQRERSELSLPTKHMVNSEKEFEPNARAVPRIRERDLQRVHQAQKLEKTSRSYRCKTWQVVQMSFFNHNLKDHSEIITLLHYLRDYVIYKCGGFYMKPRKDIGILPPARWHCSFADTMPGHDDRTPVEMAAPEHAKLV